MRVGCEGREARYLAAGEVSDHVPTRLSLPESIHDDAAALANLLVKEPPVCLRGGEGRWRRGEGDGTRSGFAKGQA